MARFIVVVVVLVAIALLANKYLFGDGDAPPAKGKAAAAKQDDAKAADEKADDAGEDAEELAADAAAKKAQAGGPAPKFPAEDAGEEAAADAVASADVDTDLEQEPGVEPKLDAEADLAAPGEKITKMLPAETVQLGDPSLTAGIPGEGEITLEEMEVWLAEPKNHVVLKPELPLGLKAGEAEMKGLDENPLTRAKIELGRQLYFDPRLSSDASVSCASCHASETGYAAATKFGVGVEGQEGNRNSPTAYNRILSGAQFWDGRAASLEEQAKGPIANPIEMSNTHEACIECLRGIPGYVKQFNLVFEDGLTIDNVAKAIASFERTLVTGPAPWDYYTELDAFQQQFAADIEDLDALKEEDQELYNEYMALKKASDDHPISESAIRGGKLFFSEQAGCTACHLGANFTDEKYHNLGVGMDAKEPDLGRFVISNEEIDKGAFKTPTCRNVAQTAPYMHDGSQATLEEVVEWYAKGGHPNAWLSEKVKKLELSDQDKADLVAFMKEGLTGELPQVEEDRLLPDAEVAKEKAEEELKEEKAEAKAA
ncbi:cytochrome-c peroxidase [Lacipirellula parvula]|uniref:Cytochrome c551 peroxidase n=1 Tax=Lacipirellula parvula TaxID=2650471 RepID=A0A5K7XHK2_9BACT|nr:cytochrome c peroxidase [Lacipirellula parvula]BBO36360.1 cytochrome c551 peroxidase [Lacipirellula parvula]